MKPELRLLNKSVLFIASSLRQFRGARLPGSEYWLAERQDFVIHFQDYHQPAFNLSYRIFNTNEEAVSFSIQEDPGHLRIDVVLGGTLILRDHNVTYGTEEGHYSLANSGTVNITIEKRSHLRYLSLAVNETVFEQASGLVNPVQQAAFALTEEMKELLKELLYNRYQAELLPFYYENCIRELLFLHVAKYESSSSVQLSSQELAAVYEADRIISENLHVHYSIRELSRKTGTNEYKLKKDFRTVFNTGLFGRLLQLRMEAGKTLLETTAMSIKDIAERAGYETVAGFITAFRKYTGIPPGEWRSKKGNQAKPGGDDDNAQNNF